MIKPVWINGADYDHVTDRLAVGNVVSRSVPGFGAIVSVITTTDRPGLLYVELPPGKGPQVPDGVIVHYVDIADGECWAQGPGAHRLETYLDEATGFIQRHLQNGCVLVHCGAGKSRSVAVVVAYLCRYAGMSYTEALALVKARRPGAAPCDAFAAAVKRWLRLDELAAKGPRR